MSQAYKHSYFNTWVESKDGSVIFLFNTNTHAVLEVPKQAWKEYEAICNVDTPNDHNRLLQKIRRDYLREVLRPGGYVVRTDLNEFRALQIEHERARWQKGQTFALTIAPTMLCNLACSYCYANQGDSRSMSLCIQDAVVKFVEELIEQRSLNRLTVTWIGGEPTFRFDILLDLSRKLVSLCKAHDVKYNATIITNGTMVTEHMAKQMKHECLIDSAQVTIDGFEHNQRRPWKNPNKFESCMECALSGLKSMSSYFSVGVRINVDLSNYNLDRLVQFSEYLVEQGTNKPNISIGFINSAFRRDGVRNSGLTMQQFGELQLKWRERLGISPSLPDRQLGGCGASKENSFCIDPEGYLSRCWDYIGSQNERIGHIKTGMFIENPCLEFDLYSPFENPKCKNCKLLPFCAGGCFARFVSISTLPENKCFQYKYNFEQFMQAFCEGLQKKSDLPSACC